MNRNDLTKCTIEGGVLTIRIGVELIAHAAKLLPDLTEYDEETGDWVEPQIVNVDQFAEEVLRQLKNESEDGTTVVHRMFDEAISEAIEYGAEGINMAGDIIRQRRKEQGSADV